MINNLPITNIDKWKLLKNYYHIDNVEAFAHMYLLNQTKTAEFLNNTIHQRVISNNLEGICLRWRGNPFNLKNSLADHE